jgi:hypothetical protein
MKPPRGHALVFALFIGSCKESPPRPILRDHPCPPGASCQYLADRGPPYHVDDDVEGARVALDILWDGNGALEVSWRAGPDGALFRATLFLQAGALFPLRGQVVELMDCHGPAYNGLFNEGPLANLLLHSPRGAAVAPASENVFVPFDAGWASIDGDRIATARSVETSSGDLVARVSADVGDRTEQKPYVRVGDRFLWSTSLATVVRIVPASDGRIGWIEVKLSRGN